MEFVRAEKYIKILKQTGNTISLYDWQKEYGLQLGSQHIGKFFKYTEPRFRQDIEQFGELVVCSLLMKVLDAFRAKVGRPVKLNSFNRTQEYQEDLERRGFKTAKFSPHVVKLACDIDTDTPEQTRREAKMLIETAKAIGINVRVGYEEYLKNGQTFIHVDVCPEYFAKGMVWHELPHPKAWETNAVW
jgi:hypothetical protein